MKENSIVKTKLMSVILRVLLYVFALALLSLIFYIYHEGAWREIIQYYRFFYDPKRLKVFIASFGPFAAFVFVIIQALQVVFAPIPGEVTGFVGGFLFGKVMGGVLSTIGLTIGSLIAFYITRLFGIKAVEKVVKKEYIDKFNHFVTHKGLYITFIFFVIPGFPKDSLCYLLGLTHIRLVDFLIMNVLGRLPGTMMLTLQGDALRHGKYQAFFILLVISLLIVIGFYITRNYLTVYFEQLINRIRKKRQK
ncbi:MAG TPA: TVP38/TMEM64 family protein [Syntrophorhabdaceae bacterium]|nr:TVP38/TMEM64 family protein [Syntrophorhabdaceae bacterium]HON84950.1 TVP38/TMEM64 family protein [Syntrophorhabdaceae bacterium]HOT41712.1 TVP38/TMEM64 family protein [Syntrophorhabdaceae bacterium]HPC66597.1 TVP38/TMEM64 family protein [Syntrophorhabdaceae bacterium]HPP42373.1 TVP38/TMEM64 family protein [Syntrophorhabdaceae bacterium]